MKAQRLYLLVSFFMVFANSYATNYYMDTLIVHGDGGFNNPFNDFSKIEQTLVAGDTLFVKPGTYNIAKAIRIKNSGRKESPIVYCAYDTNNRPIINNKSLSTQIFRLEKDYQTINGFIMDGNYCTSQLISITGQSFDNPVRSVIIRNCIIKRGKRDGVILNMTRNCIIENCEIFFCLNGTFQSQTDAHGICSMHTNNLKIANCNIHHVSGDCIQSDPHYYLHDGYKWDSLYVENCKLWTSKLTTNEADYMVGNKPGENAIDTKTDPTIDFNSYRPKVFISNVEAFGFKGEGKDIYISGQAAFNLKHNVNVVIKNCVLHDNETAYRLRGPYVDEPESFGGIHATMINCIAYDNNKNVWFERAVAQAHLYNCTFVKMDTIYCVWNRTDNSDHCDSSKHFMYDFGGYDPNGLEIKNCLFVGGAKPIEASESSNVLAAPNQFRDFLKHEFYPELGNPCIEAGIDLAEVTYDITGYLRENGIFSAGVYQYRGPLDVLPPIVTPVTSSITTSIFYPENKNGLKNAVLFHIYPNPADAFLNIKFNSNFVKESYMVNIYNATGVSVLSYSITNENTECINISNLKKGLYIIVLKNNKIQNSITSKFIKE